jgi:hypothetical protein
MNVSSGSTISFSTHAVGSPTLLFEWYKGASLIYTDPAPIDSGAPYNIFTSTYTTPAIISTDDQAQYYCHVSNAYGSINSTVCTITVGTAASITSGALTAVTITEGSPFTRTISATGTAIINYYWVISNIPVTIGDIIAGNYLGVSLGSTASLTFSPDITYNGKYLTAVAGNNYGYPATNSVLLTVNAASISAPTVFSSPVNVTDPVNPFTLSAVFTGDFLTYQWQYKTVTDSVFGNWNPSTTITDQTLPTRHTNTFSFDYSYGGSGWMNGTEFRCIATNSAGSATTTPAIVTIGVPPATVTSVTISPTSYTFQGYPDTTTFVATAHWSDLSTTDCSLAATWTNTDNTKLIQSGASSQSQGPAGSVNVTASYGGQSATATCTCTGSTVSSIAISPLNSSVAIGSYLGYTSNTTWSNSAVTASTNYTVWTSGNTSIVTIGAAYGGMGYPNASGISAGITTITGTVGPLFGTVTTSTNITVTSGGGVGGTTLYYRPSTGNGSYSFSGAIDTTSTVIDSSTVTTVFKTNSNMYTFSGFGTGVQNGTLNIRATATTSTHSSFDKINTTSSYIGIDYGYTGSPSNVLYTNDSGINNLTSAVPLTTATLVGVDLASLVVTMYVDGQPKIGLGDSMAVASTAVLSLYDIVFLTA